MKGQALYSYSSLVIVGLLVIELLAWGTPATAADTPGTWKLTGSMVTARRHSASAPLPDGRILVVGGTNTTGVDGTASVFYNSAEIYDPATGTWTATGSLTTGGRALHRATRLSNGTILITGGWNGSAALSTAEIYDPAAGTFSATAGSMTTGRAAHMQIRLFDGQVLITGGFGSSENPLASAEIYNPATGTFSAAASMTTARSHHRVNTVGPGKVLITGGYGTGGAELSSTELFTPGSNPAITGTFTPAAALAHARANHSAVELPTGEILVTGGHGGGGVLASTEIYNPDTDEFTAGPDLNHARQSHGSGVLPNGVVLIGGGNNNSSNDWDIQTNFLPSNELYDPATPSTFTLTISKFAVTGGGTSAGLWTGKSLATTGLTNQAEIYTPVMPGTLQTWEPTTNMVTARTNAVWYLLDDGRALISGGLDSAGNPLASAEVYDYLTGNFASTGSMGTPRHHHHGATLYTEKVLVTGGRPSASANVLNSAELYDPASGTFTPTGDMLRYRRLHKTTRLPNGKVLITGGLGGTSNTAGGFLSSAELYDPATGTFAWTTGGPTVGLNTARYNHQAILLYTGKVLIAGGVGSGTPSYVLLNSAELYDPATDTFATTGDMITARNSPLLTTLPNGKILVSNGHDSVTGTTGAPIQSIEIYDPATGTFTVVGNTLVARYGNRVPCLDNGKMIFVGGQTTADPSPAVTDSAELYNHVTGTFSGTSNLSTARRNFAQWSLPNGRILVAGGYDASGTVLSSAELYTPLIADEVDTTITSAPDAVTTSTSATFTFTSDPAGGTFKCSLDNAAFAPCTSPKIYSSLADGNHNFQVHATSGGITDPTPANYNWTINPVQVFTLTTAVSPVGGGTVGLVPSGGTYGSGTPVTLTANASPGYRFHHWAGDLTGTANPAQITMNSDKSVTAVFIQQFTLTIAVSPVGGGTVGLAPPGGTYDSGTLVTLTATPNTGFVFAVWGGDPDCSDGVVIMDADKTCTATFTLVCPTPGTPSSPSPSNGATGQPTSLTLSWSSTSNTDSYDVYLGTPSNPPLVGNVTSTSYPLSGLSTNTTYYWKIVAKNSCGQSSTGSVWSFTTVVSAPSAPTLSSPSNGATVVPTNPALNWNASSGATSYRLQVSTSNVFSTTVFDQSGIALTSQVVSSLLNNTTYYWRGNASNAGGTSGWSSVWSFTTNAVQVSNKFPIATTTAYEMSFSAAFDGTNYLVGMIQGDTTATQSVTAQLVSQTGALIGSLISLGVSGWDIRVAFDGTNYLIVWVVENPAGGFYDSIISGQFVNPSGTLVGSPFVINQDIGTNELSGVAFAGNNYLIIWEGDEIGKEVVRGQLVSKSGTLVGSTILITGSSSIDQNQAAVASNGTNFLAVWSDSSRLRTGLAEDIYGQFVSPSGNLSGSNFLIDQNNYPSDNPLSLACDTATGSCLVVWTDEVGGYGSGEWDVFGQLVSPSGTLVGNVISISTANGQQIAPSIAFDGINYLVVWNDMRNDADKDGVCDINEGTCWDIYGQYISKTGARVGTEFVINNDAGNQGGGVAGFNGGKYLVLINTGIRPDPPGCTEDCEIVSDDVYGVFVTPVPSGILLAGDSNGDGQTTIDEVQKCINQYLGISPVEPFNDQNSDGQVTIDEVQKVINAFLGL